MGNHEPEFVAELERLRRNKDENEMCELRDRLRKVESDYGQLKRELEDLKNARILEKWIART